MVAVIMGLFGLSELMINVEKEAELDVFDKKIEGLFPTTRDWIASAFPMLRGTAIGFFLGVIPGGGPVAASFVSYAVEKKISRHPEKFGSGIIEGVAGPEAANNAAIAGSLVPLLSLGIPGNPVTALLLGALIIHGVQPGPMLMTQHPEIFWGVIASMYIGNVILLILNLPLISIWVQFLKIPYYILFPMIFLLCVIGSYSTNQNIFDVWVMIGFGVLGYILRKLKYEAAPIILAMVLGPMFELALRQSLIMDNGNPWIFFTRPISCSILVIAIIILGLFILGNIKKIHPDREHE